MSLRKIETVIPDITVDQALVLQLINEEKLTQTEIADLIFKDYASMSRIIALMIKKDFLLKETDKNDGRVSILKITKKGESALKQLVPIINQNRKTALEGLTSEELENLKKMLNKITQNSKK
ncbi:MAG: winged helix DNA-binding protein [Crocinitomicaceae bacterium]|nr:winged helix DNA-binding protein [Flavobacteriales bacterium]NQZ36402.1 winged helix DNA-binding protein [Crocinitomicaceae bacterium]